MGINTKATNKATNSRINRNTAIVFDDIRCNRFCDKRWLFLLFGTRSEKKNDGLKRPYFADCNTHTSHILCVDKTDR